MAYAGVGAAGAAARQRSPLLPPPRFRQGKGDADSGSDSTKQDRRDQDSSGDRVDQAEEGGSARAPPAPPQRAAADELVGSEAAAAAAAPLPPVRRARPPPVDPPLQPGDPDYGSVAYDLSCGRPTLEHWRSERHPNTSPPAELLLERGAFITPTSVHYVRSHGMVPPLSWEAHTLTVTGLVATPLVLNMDDLLDGFEQVTLTAYLACVGVRRNEIKALGSTPPRGVDLGPTAIGNSTWTGVRLSDVLRRCGARTIAQGGRWVHFGGPDGEFSEPGRQYVTSLELARCEDPSQDILLAWKQNDRLLTPSHGFPLRLVAPGIIGGRCVKWLSSINVAYEDTSNYYHLHDNRVLPTEVTADIAERDGWFDPHDIAKATAYAAREGNVNSVILAPNHDEVLLQQPETQDQDVPFKGWAVSGGGRSITHVELSLDGGDSWRLANLTHHAPPNQYGKHWSWYLWEALLPISDLLGAPEVRCRAHDSAMNTQPERPCWNLMGAANNSHYILRLKSMAADDGRQGVRVGHPAVLAAPGKMVGWMVEELEGKRGQAQQDQGKRPVSSTAELQEEERQGKAWEQLRVIPMAEVQKHNSRDKGAWFVRDGKVYDATAFLDKHPGGADIILGAAGGDASAMFDAVHPDSARIMAVGFMIGRLEGAEPPLRPGEPTAAAPSATDVALDPNQRRPFKLVEKVVVSHDTRLFRFALPSPQHRLGLPVGKHIVVSATIDGKEVARPYTPTTLDNQRGHFDLVIKVYPPAPPKFPRGGRMSQHLDSLEVGRDTLDVRGPVGFIEYLGSGRFEVQGRELVAPRINMMAGGTGITPMYQVIKAILEDPNDNTQLRLLYANKTPSDILLKLQLDELAGTSGGRFQVTYTVDTPEPGWSGCTGHITTDMARQVLFPAQADSGGSGCDAVMLLCGPPPMLERACKPALRDMGFPPDHVVEF